MLENVLNMSWMIKTIRFHDLGNWFGADFRHNAHYEKIPSPPPKKVKNPNNFREPCKINSNVGFIFDVLSVTDYEWEHYKTETLYNQNLIIHQKISQKEERSKIIPTSDLPPPQHNLKPLSKISFLC